MYFDKKKLYKYKTFLLTLRKYNKFKCYGIDYSTFQDEFKQIYMCKLMPLDKFVLL